MTVNYSAKSSVVTGLLDGRPGDGAHKAAATEVMIVDPTADSDADSVSEERHTWGSKREYLLSVLGFSVGVGNIWRFPYLCNRNGGGAFLIPFILAVILIGIPMFFLETVLGQFTGRSPLHVWGFCPLIKGAGAAMSVMAVIVFWYYAVIMSWSVYYMVSSFQSTVPWTRCDGWWNTPNCTNTAYSSHVRAGLNNSDSAVSSNLTLTSMLSSNLTSMLNGTDGVSGWNGTGVYNSTAGNGTALRLVPAAEEFWQRNVLQVSSGFYETGHLVWYLAIAQVAVFLTIFLALLKGVKTSGKVVYVTATAPYILLTILLVRGATLPGAGRGILFYITPDFKRLLDAKVWVEAAIQVFYSLGPAWGPAITLASYNKFHNNCLRDSIFVSIVGEATSVFGGFTIFSVLGYMSYQSGVPIDKVVSSGPGLAFIVYPEAISLMPLPQLWAILFFFMLITAAIDTELACGETVMTVICDQFPHTLAKRRTLVTGVVIFFLMVTSLIFVSQSGVYWFQLVDWFVASYNLTSVAILEVFVIAWVYGADRFAEDIEMMIGRKPPVIMRILWCFVSPIILVVLLVFTLVSYEPPSYGDYHYDTAATVLGWMVATLSFLPIPLFMLAALCRSKGSLLQRLKETMSPDDTWGPADPDRRNLYRQCDPRLKETTSPDDTWGPADPGRRNLYRQKMMKRDPRRHWLDVLRS
ncbi:sodium-dependent proline transporter-like [Babylonia areolata]|uniref:sodium-dependent proline transporter-like n=1 Tax=Babylonia areolata TaxID=304850 RepID=UPI003FD67F16